MKKKILSIILCSALAVSSAITANAREIDSSSFVDLKNEFKLPQGSLLLSGYNIDKNHPGMIRYTEGTKHFNVELKFNDCSDAPKTVRFNRNIDYCFAWVAADGDPYTGVGFTISDCKGGKYKKVRVKLSDFSYNFTEDGKLKHTENNGTVYTDDLRKKTNSKGSYYNAFCVIKSGAAHTAVIPDKNGEAEFYISTNPNHKTRLMYDLKTSKINFTSTVEQLYLRFGDSNKSGHTDVNDVTHMQLAIAGLVTLDDYGKFNADINLDGIRDIQDVTDLQIALSQKEQ